ncbi:molybdenum cofactor sulfurase isoform X2 [Macadamia integrifolia]|uniref:molybdenum cofactor sulfurase isoform X2 n=1 Tax=Macadamia integrifolia TaxID=60698 RepID=UPI001C4EF9BE|nr:molybdenum cofactor sulfurase isoform X2 [Macadamia integrifolia]
MDRDKEEFLKEFGEDYGYPNSPKNIDEIRTSEFKRLDGVAYLDHAGATLYSELQMETIFKDLTSKVYGNPHSQSDSSLATSEVVRAARQQVLDYCNASPEDYKCIFTSGATSALKLVGESFPWSRESSFMYTVENHNSVLGIREYALDQGAVAFAVDIEEDQHKNGVSRKDGSTIKVAQYPAQRRNGGRLQDESPGGSSSGDVYNLFAFPSECNFSGVKFSLDLANIVKNDAKRVLGNSPTSKGHWMVLVDAAKGCATAPPDLSRFPVDFLAISFYKIFGYPSGLGALVVRSEAAELLKKKYFGGGTVAACIADVDFVRRRKGIEESFEDGTQSFLSIAAIHYGFRIINSLTISAIARHTAALSTYLRKTLLSLRHANGASVCTLYGRDSPKISSCELGPTVTFNLKRSDSSWVGYREVEKLASLSGIHLRTGCFCNPGACAKYVGLSHLDLLSNIEAGHVCWDDNDILHGKPTGAVRISFGYMSTYEDVKKFISFTVNFFVSLPNQAAVGYILRGNSVDLSTKERCLSTSSVHLKSITIYPIKSCGGFSVNAWPLSSSGLQHDREWLLKSPDGEILTQKKAPEMCLISTFIDLTQGILVVESPRCNMKLQINTESDPSHGVKEVELQSQRYVVRGYCNEVDLWFTKAISRPCTLLRCYSSEYHSCMNNGGSAAMCRDVGSKLNFVNEAQFLLISEDSVSDLNTRLCSNVRNASHQQKIHIDPMRFRPNLVISGAEPYAEDSWSNLNIGNKHFTSLGGCNRCQMINLDPQTGKVHNAKEPLATLASYRRVKGRIFFGILLRQENIVGQTEEGNSWIQVGESVHLE